MTAIALASLEAIETRHANLISEATEILDRAGDADLVGDDLARYSEIETELDTLKTRKDRLDRLNTATRNGGAISGDGATTTPMINRLGADPHTAIRNNPHLVNDPTELPALARSAIETINGIDDTKADHLRTLVANPADAAVHLAKSDPVYERAFAKHLANPQLPNLLDQHESAAMATATRAALTVAGSGSVLVPTAIDPQFILTNDSAGPTSIRRFARTATIGVSTWQGITSAGITASMDGEAAEVSEDTPTVATVSAALKKAQAFVQYSIEAGQDQTSLPGELQRALADARYRLEEQQFATGTGTGNDVQGWITALDGTASEDLAPNTAETLTLADVYDTQAVLPTRHLASASAAWVMHPGTALGLRELATALSSSSSVWTDLGPGQPAMLNGYPVLYSDQAPNSRAIDPAVTAANTAVITLGDWSRFVIVEHSAGTVLEMVPLVMGANQRPNGTRGIYAAWRFGAKLVDIDAFRTQSVPTVL